MTLLLQFFNHYFIIHYTRESDSFGTGFKDKKCVKKQIAISHIITSHSHCLSFSFSFTFRSDFLFIDIAFYIFVHSFHVFIYFYCIINNMGFQSDSSFLCFLFCLFLRIIISFYKALI